MMAAISQKMTAAAIMEKKPTAMTTICASLKRSDENSAPIGSISLGGARRV
jgi:hypothetical protein